MCYLTLTTSPLGRVIFGVGKYVLYNAGKKGQDKVADFRMPERSRHGE
jgi:hypothetical protein